MSTHEAFWTRVDELLDARRDPFADPAVADALLDHPTLLDELEQLMDRLQHLPRAAAPRVEPPALAHAPTLVRAPRRAAAAVLLAALGLALGALAWFATTPAGPGAELPTPRARIHFFHSSVHHERRVAPLPKTPARPVLVSWRQTWTTP